MSQRQVTAPIAQWLERMTQEAGGPGFDPHLVELSGLRVRPFKVSGGSPCPPPEQTPVVTSKDSSSLQQVFFKNIVRGTITHMYETRLFKNNL